MDTETGNIYKLDDIQIASYCLTQGVKLIDVKADTSRHFTFILSNPNKCHQLKIAYLNGATAPAQELFSKREMLISEMRQTNRRGVGNG